MEGLFFDTAEECMHHYWQNEPVTFKVVAEFRERDRIGIAHPLSGGDCSSSNCFGSTGCTPLTQNGYCACSGPKGPCVWVPGV